MARDPQTPTPSRDMDVFGKDLALTSAEKQLLAGEEEIFLKKSLAIEIPAKRGETTEPRVLVITSSRCLIITHRPTAKLENSFNFLRIQKMECTESILTFHLSREQRPMRLHVDKKDSIIILGLITAQLKNVFPITPLELITQVTFDPVSLRNEMHHLRDSLLSAMDRVDGASMSGFITAYAFICDFFGVPFNNEVKWYLKNVYLTHGFKDLRLADFSHLATKDIRPLLSALRHNEFFEGFIEKDNKMDSDLLDEVCYIINVSRSLKKLILNNCSLRPDYIIRLCTALKDNPRPSLTYLDLSHNPLDEKAIEALGAGLETLPQGLHELILANCKITPKGGTQIANNMIANKFMRHSLVNLDLSQNLLGPDPQGCLGFLKDPQTVASLNLSNCGLNIDMVMPILFRGCQQHLRDLDLSHNRPKKSHGQNVGSHLQQFCSSAIAIATINISECKLSSDVIVGLLEGLAVNPNIQAMSLDVSGNDLGSGKTPNNVAMVISRTPCLSRLDVSECGIDGSLPSYVTAVKNNKSIKHLVLGRNFGGKGNSRVAALKGLSDLLSSADCQLESLSLADSHLKEQTSVLLEALASNTSLTKLDISGNGMALGGARSLARAFLSNCSLREVVWDKNDTSLQGFSDVASAMEHNYTLQVMPLPLHDIIRCSTREPQVEEQVQRMQLYLCRNHSDERLKVQLAARHRQRLLTATQQSALVSRELVQLEDLLKWAEGHLEEEEEGLIPEAVLVREEANKVVQLTDGLYAPHVEREQLDSVSGEVETLVTVLMGKLHQQHIQDNSQRMVQQSVKACPNLLSHKEQSSLNKLVVTEPGSDFHTAKRTVVSKVVPEIINPISAANLDLAATLSEHLVDKALAKLERISAKLIKLQKAFHQKTSGATPDQKVSRKFTFRAEGAEEQPKVKRKRPLSALSDEIDLPSTPLKSEAPKLQHVGKSRPKPARLQKGGAKRAHKPAHLAQPKEEVDVGEFVKAVKEAEENSSRIAKEEEKKAKGSRANGPMLPNKPAKFKVPDPVKAPKKVPVKEPVQEKKEVEEVKKEEEEIKEEEEVEEEEEEDKVVVLAAQTEEEEEEEKEEDNEEVGKEDVKEEEEEEEEEEEKEEEEETKEVKEEGKEEEVAEEKKEEEEEVGKEEEEAHEVKEEYIEEEKKEKEEEEVVKKEEEEEELVIEKAEEEEEEAIEDAEIEKKEEEEEEEEKVSSHEEKAAKEEEKANNTSTSDPTPNRRISFPPPPTSPPTSPPPPPFSPSSPISPSNTTSSDKDTSLDHFADISTSSSEVQAKGEQNPTPLEEATPTSDETTPITNEVTPSKSDKKSRTLSKKEEKERERLRKEKEKEEKERDKKEKEESERQRKQKEKEDKERDKKEKEERERVRKEKEKEDKERDKKEKEEKEKLRKEKEREEREKEKEEKERLKKEKEDERKREKEKESDSTEGSQSMESSSETPTGAKRKSKTVKETRKKGLFGRPKSRFEEATESPSLTSDDSEPLGKNEPQPQPSPRRQTTPTSPHREAEGGKRAPPPKVKQKPQKSPSVDLGLDPPSEEAGEEGGGEVEKRRIPVGGVATVPLGQLASVLKHGRSSPQIKPRVRPPSSVEGSPHLSDRTSSEPSSRQSPSSSSSHRIPPVAPRPKPKPKPRKTASAYDLKDDDGSSPVPPEEEATRPAVRPKPKPASRSTTPSVPTSNGEGNPPSDGSEVKGQEDPEVPV